MSRKPRAKKPKAPKSEQDLAKYIVTKYVKKSLIIWPRDVKIAYDLIKIYPEQEFWERLPCSIKSPALTHIITSRAKAYIYQQYLNFKLVIPEKIVHILEDNKVGEDRIIPHIPNSILEFCK